jgi:hypothetical protein
MNIVRMSLSNPVYYNDIAFDRLPEIIGTGRLTAFYFNTFSFTISIRVSLTLKISIS